MFCKLGGSGLTVYLTVVLTAVLGGLLVFNLIGCFFGLRWKKRQGQTGKHNYIPISGC